MNIKILLLIICIICHVNFENILAVTVTTISIDTSKDIETTTTTTETSVQNVTEIIKDGEPLPTPLALKTFRSYIETPFTIIKHRTRFIKPRSKPRRRIKIPKPIYGPPNYVAGDPITFYKPQSDSFELSTISSSSIPKIKYEESTKIKPNYFDSDSEINIQSIPMADFKKYLPSNSYDFTRNAYYEKQPISFDLYENLQLSKEESYNGFGRNQQPKFEEHYVVNKIPEIKYQKYPAPHSTYSSSESYEIPSSNSHSISDSEQSSYEPSSHGYDSDSKNFAEPPIDIHYSYDTEYEINPLPPSTKTNIYSGQKYLPPTDSTDYKDTHESSIYKSESPDYSAGGTGYFAEPPHHDSYAPIENSKLPLDNSEKTTTYDYPKSSYEVPLYDTNVNSDSAVHDEYYPPNIPNTYLSVEDDNNLAKTTKNVEITLIKNTTTNPIKTKHQRGQTQIISTQIIPLTSQKSINQIPNQEIEYVESSLNSTTLKPRRKRKRTRTPPTQKIHNLDTDELRDAFGSETNQKFEKILQPHFIPTPLEPKLSLNSPQNEKSNIVQLHKNHLGNNNDFYAYLWEPVKVKELTTRSKNSSKLNKKNPLFTTTDSSRNHPPMPTKNFEVISVQESKSHSYYDGTISPEVFKELDRVRKYPPKYQNIRDNSNDFAVLTSNIMVSTNSDIERNFKLKGSVIDEKIENNNPTYDYWTKEAPNKT